MRRLLLLGMGVVACAQAESSAPEPRTPAPPLSRAQVREVFDPAAQVEDRPASGVLPELHVLDMRPLGRSGGGDIVLRFDRVVAAKEALPAATLVVESQARDGSWESVPGETTWTRTDRLRFEPDDEFPPAHRIRVQLVGAVQDVKDVSWAFETSRPLFDFDDPWDAVSRRGALRISVDEPTSAETLAEHLHVSGPDGKDIPMRVRALPASEDDEDDAWSRFSILPRSRWPAGVEMTVAVEPSFRGDEGVLPLGTPLEWTVETQSPFRLSGVSCDEKRGSLCPLGPISLDFTHDPDDVSGIRMVPEPDDFSVWSEDGGAILDADFRPGTRYRIVVPADMRDESDRALRGPRSASVRFSNIRASGDVGLGLSSRGGIFASAADARIGVFAEGVKEAQLRIAVLDAGDGADVLEDRRDDGEFRWPDGGEQTTLLLGFAREGRDAHRGRVVDLSRWAKAGDTVVVEVGATELHPKARGSVDPVRGVYRISELGVWVHSGPARGVVRVTDLETGQPRSDAPVEVRGPSGKRDLGRTDADGLIALPGAVRLDPRSTVVVRTDGDALAVPLARYDWKPLRRPASCKTSAAGICQWFARRGGSRVARSSVESPPEPLRLGERIAHGIQVGRGVYMPGDAVHVAGWAGINTPHGEYNNRKLPEGTPVELSLARAGRRPGAEIAVGRAKVNAHGRFSASLRVPGGAALGTYILAATIVGEETQTRLLVAEPRIPTFEVHAHAKRETVPLGDPLELRIEANAFSGEPAPMHQLDWTVQCHATTPDLPDLEKGFSARTDAYIPAWSSSGRLPTHRRPRANLSVATDALDHHSFRSCSLAVSAQDASRQPIGAEDSVGVNPGPGFLAVRMSDLVAGMRPRVVARVVGKRGGPMKAETIRLALERDADSDAGKPARVLTVCNTVDPDPEGASLCRARTLSAGQYTLRVTAQVEGKPLALERHVYISKPPAHKPRVTRPAPTVPRRAKTRRFEVDAPDRVKPSEAFDVTVSGPWDEASGVLTVEQTGLRESLPFSLHNGASVVRVTPRVGAGELLQITARVARPPEGGKQPRVEDAAKSVEVEDRGALRVVVVPPEHARPGTRTGFEVEVHDERGDPVDARLAIWVVDDALHSLRRPHRARLESAFNPLRPYELAITDPHRELLRPFSPDLYGRTKRVPRVRTAKAMVKGALDFDARQRFVPVPLFVGDVATGPDGSAHVPLALADDLTRFRITVVASAELAQGTGPARFGANDATFEVTAPLPVRAALPRALRPGDQATVAAVITVREAGKLTVVAGSEHPCVQLQGPTSKTREVAAGEVVRMEFAARAGAPGKAALRFSATLRTAERETLKGAVLQSLSVAAERTAVERAAVYGSLETDRPVAVPLRLPEAARGRVAVAVSNTILGDLQDAADYLVEYPYGCVEQTSSRLLPLIALRGRVADPTQVDAQISKALSHLQSMQLGDGRFAYWPKSRQASAFGTAYATWVLLQAKEAGILVPPRGLSRALESLGQTASAEVSAEATGRERHLIERSLAVWALASAGRLPAGALDKLWPYRQDMPAFARLLYLQAMHRADPKDARIDPLMLSVSASIEQRAGVAHVVDPAEEGRWWYAFSSAARTEALTLMTLLEVAPEDPRIEKLVRGLRARRRGGRWRTTQENAFALIAMSRFAARFEPETPKQRVQAWIGPQRVVDAEFRGFDPDAVGGGVDLRRALEEAGEGGSHVVVQREGTGRAYYRVGVEWTAPRDAPARAQGVSISRTLPSVVTLGESTRVDLELNTDAALHHVAVEVPLPAGLEAVDTQLGSGVRARVAEGTHTSWLVSHQELRPDRVVLFFDYLPPGTTQHSVPLVATTPGQFELPAAVVEAMYEPETRARTTRKTIVVTPK